MLLGCAELQAEVRSSSFHGKRTRERLAVMIEHLVKLSVVLTHVLLVVVPFRDGTDTATGLCHKLQQSRSLLLQWHHDAPFLEDSSAMANEGLSVILHIALMHTYYQ